MAHLFPRFIADDAEYDRAVAEWRLVWEEIPTVIREGHGWRPDWFKLQPPNDGNPIFSAISDIERKAIRVIQYEPTMQAPEIDCWVDTFGGDPIEPQAIRQLVIACALSTETKARARDIMAAWVAGDLELVKRSGSYADLSAANIRSSGAQCHERFDLNGLAAWPIRAET